MKMIQENFQINLSRTKSMCCPLCMLKVMLKFIIVDLNPERQKIQNGVVILDEDQILFKIDVDRFSEVKSLFEVYFPKESIVVFDKI